MLKESKKWCKFNPKYKYNDAAKFGKIIDFYLWKCPAPNTACNAKVFRDYGWKEPYQFKSLKKKLLQLNSGNKISYIEANRDDFEGTLRKYGQFDSHKFSEIIIIIDSASGMADLFKKIRNGLAHGSFLIHKNSSDKQYYYFLENRNPDSGVINMRLVLKTSTLISWIKIVESGP